MAADRSSKTPKRPVSGEDPLTWQQARSLLALTGVIRDPVHGDIKITSLERKIVDSEAMQRLKGIRQLAMVDVVYPGATHTRFLHSLGVLHVCVRMLTACDETGKNFRRVGAPASDPLPLRIGAYPKLLARLVALLHDAAHVPFGHVFEREAHVFKLDEWDDPWRCDQVFGPDASLRRVVRDYFVRHFRAPGPDYLELESQSAESVADRVLDEVRSVLLAMDDAKAAKKEAPERAVSALRYPFVYDLVSNTLCADLVDYLKRDMFFCGLPGDIGTRCLDYLGVMPVKRSLGDNDSWEPFRHDVPSDEEPFAFPAHGTEQNRELCRVALLPYRYGNRAGAMHKRYVVVEAVEIVRRRKMLAEAAYFHKTKLCATSMLAASVTDAGFKEGKDVWHLSDGDVIDQLCRHKQGNENLATQKGRAALRASRLAEKLKRRELFTPVFCLRYHKRENDAGKRLWNTVYPRFSEPQSRALLIDLLEQVVHAWLHVHKSDGHEDKAFGSISISCPHENMQLKALGMLVMYEPRAQLKTLEAVAESEWLKDEIAALEHGHRELWSLEVFVDPDVVDPESSLARSLVSIIRGKADGLPNSLPRFSDTEPATEESVIQALHEEWLHAKLREDGRYQNVPLKQYDGMKQAFVDVRGESGEELLIDSWRHQYESEFGTKKDGA